MDNNQNKQQAEQMFSKSEPFFSATNNASTEAASFAQMDTKNLGISEDQMHHEALAYKKCTLYSEYFQDQTLKNLANCAAQHHRQHFDALQSYLNCHK